MFWLFFHIICILNVQGDLIEVKKVYFLENKFWNDGQKQVKTDKGFLSKVSISFEDGKNFFKELDYYLSTCHLLEFTNHRYALLDDEMTENMAACPANQMDKRFLKFEFFFTEYLIEERLSFEKYVGKKEIYTAYEIFKNEPENKNSISKYDGIDTRMFHIKERIMGLISMGPLTFDMFISVLDGKRLKMELGNIEEASKFNLCYFNNHPECIESFKEFIKNLCHINLVKDEDTLKVNKSLETELWYPT